MHTVTADHVGCVKAFGSAAPGSAAPMAAQRGVLKQALVQIDLQNFDAFVQSNCGVNPYRLDLIDFTHAWLAHHGIEAAGIRIYTGIHDEEREPQKSSSARKRLSWFRSKGASVYAQRLAYQEDSHTRQVRAREKGVDVRLGCEVIEAVTLHGIRNIVVLSQDRDLLSAIDVARSICAAKHWDFEAFSPEVRDLSRVEQNPRCPARGLPHTTRLDVPLDMIDRFVSAQRPALNETDHLSRGGLSAETRATPVDDGAFRSNSLRPR